MMKLNELAKRVGKSAPYVMTLQKKFGLSGCKDYSAGYAVLVKKLIYLSICSVPDKEIKSLLSKEKKLLELRRYAEILKKVKVRIKQELPIVVSALKWAAHI